MRNGNKSLKLSVSFVNLNTHIAKITDIKGIIPPNKRFFCLPRKYSTPKSAPATTNAIIIVLISDMVILLSNISYTCQ